MLLELFTTFAIYTAVPIFLHALAMSQDPVLFAQTALWAAGVWGICKYIGHIQYRDMTRRLQASAVESLEAVERERITEVVVYAYDDETGEESAPLRIYIKDLEWYGHTMDEQHIQLHNILCKRLKSDVPVRWGAFVKGCVYSSSSHVRIALLSSEV